MTPWTKWKLVRFLATFLALFVAWMLFAGSINQYSLIWGILVSTLLSALSYTFFVEADEAGKHDLLPNPILLLLYLPYIILRVYAASFQLLFNIALGRTNPRVVHFRTRLHSGLARTMLCASITLTPGTIAILIDDDHLLVHWFVAETRHSKGARQVIAGSMERFLSRIWS